MTFSQSILQYDATKLNRYGKRDRSSSFHDYRNVICRHKARSSGARDGRDGPPSSLVRRVLLRTTTDSDASTVISLDLEAND